MMALIDGPRPVPEWSPEPLPVLDQPPRERADAARNRRALLVAAQKILAECGIDALSMERVAAEAGVGVGTVYRRFGDRGGLAFALLDHGETQFQAAFMSGPPPLGPGAPPRARLRAFLHGYADRLETDGELHAVVETGKPARRYHVGAYRTARAHLVGLLTEAGVTGHVSYLADTLLAALGAVLFMHQRHELGFSLGHIKAGLDQILAGMTADLPDELPDERPDG